jgi:hypothetical protein
MDDISATGASAMQDRFSPFRQKSGMTPTTARDGNLSGDLDVP